MKLPNIKIPKRALIGDINPIKYRKWWYLISLIIIIPGIAATAFWGLKPSIDFTGGSRMELKGTSDIEKSKKAAVDAGLENVVVQRIGGDSVGLRFKEIDEVKHKETTAKLKVSLGENISEVNFETVGPTISKEITQKAFLAIALASAVIVIYVAISFRKVPFPAKSWEFGIAAVLALLHDTVVVVGIFAFLGHYFNVEVDPLFITALLTVIGFSVHDTIVIFDRIRENLIKKGSDDFEGIVNLSVVEMLPRTLNTSFLVWSILLILLLFGGSTIRYFVLALVIGIFSGTYSSILNAAPLLVTWQNFKKKLKKKA
jgi:preprotein translocase subunit SecF